MQEILQFLTEIQPPRNHENIDSLNRVADFIYDCFTSCGLDVSFQSYAVEGKTYKNVIGILNPHLEKTLIIGGHYDVCGNTPGADDNASAVASVCESAKMLSYYREEIDFSIQFVCFTLEEPPYFNTEHMGSYIHAKSLRETGFDVVGMINYEMIGYFSDEKNSQIYPDTAMASLYPSCGNFIANVANTYSMPFLQKLHFGSIDNKIKSYDFVLPDNVEMLHLSDHINYWKFNIPAIMITDTAFLRNPNYHKESDTLETLNIEKIGYVVDMVVNAVRGLANFRLE